MSNVIVIAILIIVVGAACLHLYKEKKKGRKCIGCPMAGNCSNECNKN